MCSRSSLNRVSGCQAFNDTISRSIPSSNSKNLLMLFWIRHLDRSRKTSEIVFPKTEFYKFLIFLTHAGSYPGFPANQWKPVRIIRDSLEK